MPLLTQQARRAEIWFGLSPQQLEPVILFLQEFDDALLDEDDATEHLLSISSSSLRSFGQLFYHSFFRTDEFFKGPSCPLNAIFIVLVKDVALSCGRLRVPWSTLSKIESIYHRHGSKIYDHMASLLDSARLKSTKNSMATSKPEIQDADSYLDALKPPPNGQHVNCSVLGCVELTILLAIKRRISQGRPFEQLQLITLMRRYLHFVGEQRYIRFIETITSKDNTDAPTCNMIDSDDVSTHMLKFTKHWMKKSGLDPLALLDTAPLGIRSEMTELVLRLYKASNMGPVCPKLNSSHA